MCAAPASDLSAAYEDAMLAGDANRVKDALARDVVLNSPVTPKPFRGQDEVGFVLAQIIDIFEDLRFTDVLRSPDRCGVVFDARIGERMLQGIDYLTFDTGGLICEFTVMIRPLTGVLALQNRMAPRFGATPLTLSAPG
jgi:hypothetical protein